MILILTRVWLLGVSGLYLQAYEGPSTRQPTNHRLDVVFVAKGQQAKLRQYISDHLAHRCPRVKLTRRQGRHLQVESKRFQVHIDDMTWPEEKDADWLPSFAIDIKIDPGALVFLKPR